MGPRELWQLGDDELLDVLRENQAQLNRGYAEQLALLGELSSRNLSMAKGTGRSGGCYRICCGSVRLRRGAGWHMPPP
jgi:hypothetical protein